MTEPVFNVTEILSRAKSVLNMKTDAELATFLGVARSTLANWYARNSIDFALVLQKINWVNYNWLLTGKGSSEKNNTNYSSDLVKGEINILYEGKLKEVFQERSVTLYDISAAANLKTLFNNTDENILGKIVIPNIPNCDGAMYISGDSMYPILKSGDIIGFKQIHNVSLIIYGEMYVISFDYDGDEFIVVKYINRSELDGHIKLISYNNYHEPMDIPISSIRALGLVKFSIRKQTTI